MEGQMEGSYPVEAWVVGVVAFVLAICLFTYPIIMSTRRRPDRGDALPLSHNERMLTDAPLAEVTEIAGYEVKVRLVQEVRGLTSKIVDMFARVEVQVPELDGVVIEKVSTTPP
jgi:hypothetical protein